MRVVVRKCSSGQFGFTCQSNAPQTHGLGLCQVAPAGPTPSLSHAPYNNTPRHKHSPDQTHTYLYSAKKQLIVRKPSQKYQHNGQPTQNPRLQRLDNQHQPSNRARPPRPNHARTTRQRRHRAHSNGPPPASRRSRLEREPARVRAEPIPIWRMHELLRGDGEGES